MQRFRSSMIIHRSPITSSNDPFASWSTLINQICHMMGRFAMAHRYSACKSVIRKNYHEVTAEAVGKGDTGILVPMIPTIRRGEFNYQVNFPDTKGLILRLLHEATTAGPLVISVRHPRAHISPLSTYTPTTQLLTTTSTTF